MQKQTHKTYKFAYEKANKNKMQKLQLKVQKVLGDK